MPHGATNSPRSRQTISFSKRPLRRRHLHRRLWPSPEACPWSTAARHSPTSPSTPGTDRGPNSSSIGGPPQVESGKTTSSFFFFFLISASLRSQAWKTTKKQPQNKPTTFKQNGTNDDKRLGLGVDCSLRFDICGGYSSWICRLFQHVPHSSIPDACGTSKNFLDSVACKTNGAKLPGPSFAVSCLEVPDSSGLGRNQPGDPLEGAGGKTW